MDDRKLAALKMMVGNIAKYNGLRATEKSIIKTLRPYKGDIDAAYDTYRRMCIARDLPVPIV